MSPLAWLVGVVIILALAMYFKTVVRPEHLNQHGCLFGGYMLLWVDEYVYIAALEDFPNAHFVTRAMEAVSFTKSVPNGAILTFDIRLSKKGKTSATYSVDVEAMAIPSGERLDVFHTHVTMCNVDEDGNKKLLAE